MSNSAGVWQERTVPSTRGSWLILARGYTAKCVLAWSDICLMRVIRVHLSKRSKGGRREEGGGDGRNKGTGILWDGKKGTREDNGV